MKLTIYDILEKAIFEKYTVLSGEENFSNEIESMSILETPEFQNYIIKNSLILTTFYPIKTDTEATLKLIQSLHDQHTAGLIIKVHRYVDQLPKEVIALAQSLQYPIITLDYDANLSILFNNIMSEIQNVDFLSSSFDQNYSTILSNVYKNPTTKTLMDSVKSLHDIDLLLHNLEDNKIHASSEQILDEYEKFNFKQSSIIRCEDHIIYSEDVYYQDHPIYKMVLSSKLDRRHIIHNYVEIFKIIIVIIYQKKLENLMLQSRFIHQFLSQKSFAFSAEEIIETTRKYNWNIKFPVIILLFHMAFKSDYPYTNVMLNAISEIICEHFEIHPSEARSTMIEDHPVFILNLRENKNISDVVNLMYMDLTEKFPGTEIKVSYSNEINDANDIPNKYELLSSTMSNALKSNLTKNIFSESNLSLIHLLSSLKAADLVHYIRMSLSKLLEYEKNNNTPLIDTLYEYISTKFNVKQASENLFIHYNTMRYRLSIIHSLGINIEAVEDLFHIYFALYLYKNVYEFEK